MKTCSKCKAEKESSEFGKRKLAKDGLQSCCKPCSNETNKAYRKNNKEKIKAYNKAHRPSEYSERRRAYDKAYNKNRRETNKDDIREKARVYRKANRERINISVKARRNSSPLLTMSANVRNSVRRYIKGSKTKSTIDIIGCTFKEFKAHIGEYTSNDHLDHIIPLSWAVCEEEIYLLNHHSNFQVLTAFENISKHNKYVKRVNSEVVLRLHPEHFKIKKILNRNYSKII